MGHNIDNIFCENWSVGSEVEKGDTHTHTHTHTATPSCKPTFALKKGK
jgi:hypothetical protein